MERSLIRKKEKSIVDKEDIKNLSGEPNLKRKAIIWI